MERQKLKLPKKRCKLGDIAQLIGVKKFILREWEKQFGMTRDTDQDECGYTQRHLDQFAYIKALIYDEGNSIKKAQVIFAEKFSLPLATPPETAAPEVVSAPILTHQEPITSDIVTAPQEAPATPKEDPIATWAEPVCTAMPSVESITIPEPTPEIEPAVIAATTSVCILCPESISAPESTPEPATQVATPEPTFIASKPTPLSEEPQITGAVRACTLPPPTTLELTACEAPVDTQQEILAALRQDLEILKQELITLQQKLAPASRIATPKDQPSVPC